uniref:DH domain-containing protein n=1 Tax=Ditylenchus dipsaci TaxID=166011 RepID=A0A915CLZ7_9BILA
MSPSMEASSPSLPQPSSSAQKRTSLRRFFNSGNNSSSNQQAKPAAPHANSTAANRLSADASSIQHQHSNGTSANATASLETQQQTVTPTVLSQASTSAPPLAPNATVVDSSSSSGLPATSSSSQPSSSSTADLDLPPPMSQLNFPAMPPTAGEDNAPTAGCSTPTMNDSGTCPNPAIGDLASAEGNGETSSPAPADEQTSAAGTPQSGFPPSGIAQMSAEDGAKVKREYVGRRIYCKFVIHGIAGRFARKDKIIFANIAQILDFHKTIFLKEIEKCLENYEAAGNAFVKYERRLNTYYVKYCQNKPKSDFLVSQESFEQFFAETKQQLGHKVALCDLLIKPVQRITKYQLMLSDI